MGVYNTVKVEGDWIPEELKVGEFQTKDEIEDLFQEEFTITKDGRLMFEKHTYEWRPDPERQKLGGLRAIMGALKIASTEMIDENFHGDFHFYNSLIDCVARFTNGQLEHITYGRSK